MSLDPPVLAEQVVQVAVQESVLPDQLEKHVKEEPRILHVADVVGCLQQRTQRLFVAVEQPVDE